MRPELSLDLGLSSARSTRHAGSPLFTRRLPWDADYGHRRLRGGMGGGDVCRCSRWLA